MSNLRIYEKVRAVPLEAQKKIGGGRLKGMTDINPMWRIKALTEQFGPCGVGWRYEVVDKQLSPGADGTVAAFVDILLYCKECEEWGAGIPGTGGSMFVAKEDRGLYTDDECFKKALTDAISVAAKALGVGADIYFAADRTKYDAAPEPPKQDKPKTEPQTTMPSVSENPEVNRLRGIILAELKQNLAIADKAANARYKKNFYDLSLVELQEVAAKVTANAEEKEINRAARMDTRHEDAGDRL